MSQLRKLTVSLALAGALTAAGAAPALAATKAPERPAVPAAAAGQAGAQPHVAVGVVITAITTAYNIYKQFLAGGTSTQAATQQIINAINSSQTAIISHIDAVAAADVQACALSAVIDYNDFNALSPDNQQNFAINATACVTRADSLLNTVTDKGAKDQLGFALNTVGPIALMARASTGLTNTSLTPVLQNGNQVLYNDLIPSCRSVVEAEPGTPKLFFYDCTAYNGTEAELPYRPGINDATALANARDTAGANISWFAAELVLPDLV